MADTSGEDALVIGVGQGVCIVRTASGDRVCRTKKGVVVGDRVNVDAYRVLSIYPRTTVLVRPDPRNPRNERALAANVDIVVIVASVHSPPLRTGLIDRYLIAAQNGAMQPVIVVNKIDLLQDESELDELKAYDGIGVALVLCSTKDGRGMEELRAVLAGKTCVFSGHSGVGKSSLANALLPGLDLRIGAVEYKGAAYDDNVQSARNAGRYARDRYSGDSRVRPYGSDAAGVAAVLPGVRGVCQAMQFQRLHAYARAGVRCAGGESAPVSDVCSDL